jgi:hypothetical protein
VRAIHRKAHLWDREKLLFAPGDRPSPVVSTAFRRLAMMVCYDLELPEYVRQVAGAGADLLCAPTNWPLAGQLGGPHGGVALASCHLDLARDKRLTEHNHVLADRRPELYRLAPTLDR